MTDPTADLADPRVPGHGLSWLRPYLELTKPRIIELLLITTVPAMIVAADGWPGTGLVLATLVGGTLSAGGANAINQVIDRDIDAVMRRTKARPLPTDRVGLAGALAFGAALGVLGFGWLWLTTNLAAALVATAGLLFYVFAYSLFLKRSTAQNIVIGGAAGAVPPLVGWAAVTGELALPAWIMFALIFFWTPPHFWALSLRYRDDYQAARIPMLPVVIGERGTLDHILLYSVVAVGVSLLLFPAVPMGWIYLAAAGIVGALFVGAALRLRRHPGLAMGFFGFSNVYLATVFVAMAVDRLLL